MSGPDHAAARARAADPDDETRYQAVAVLDPADPEDRPVLLARLADASWRVRAVAVERISGGSGAAAALPALVEVLAAGPGPGARDAAAAALGRIGAPAIPLVVERLSAPDSDTDLRQAAAGVLGAIGDPRAVPALTARLADPDPNVRGAVAEALGKIGGLDAVAALRAAVDSDDATLRLSAVEALGALRASLPAARIEALLGDRALRRALYRMIGASDDLAALALVARGVADPSRAGREAALAALGRQRARRTLAELAPVLDAVGAAAASDPALCDAWAAALASDDHAAQVGAVTALSAARSGRHAGALVRLAEDDRLRTLVEEVVETLPESAELRASLADVLPGLGQLARLTALAALARLGSPAAFENLVREASDGGSYVQGDAIAALGRLRDARGVPHLAGLLANDDRATAGLAAVALVRIGQSGPAVREAALAAARDRGGTGPCAAVFRALGALGDEADLPALAAGLEATGAPERAAAAAALAALAQRRLLRTPPPALARALSDSAWEVRAASARALGEVARTAARACAAEVAAALVRALEDPEGAVRAAAAEALGACGREEGAAPLAALARDPEAPPLAVAAALHALAALDRLPADALERALAHDDPELVKEAVAVAARLPGEAGLRLLRAAAGSPRWDVRRAVARAFADRGDAALRPDAERLAAGDPDPLVARAFADAAQSLGRAGR
jgi:HEAT repeat protein